MTLDDESSIQWEEERFLGGAGSCVYSHPLTHTQVSCSGGGGGMCGVLMPSL